MGSCFRKLLTEDHQRHLRWIQISQLMAGTTELFNEILKIRICWYLYTRIEEFTYCTDYSAIKFVSNKMKLQVIAVEQRLRNIVKVYWGSYLHIN